MMNAKEMFEELGYKEHIDEKYLIGHKMDFVGYLSIALFDVENKILRLKMHEKQEDLTFSIVIDLEYFKAITQQIKELGWLDE